MSTKIANNAVSRLSASLSAASTMLGVMPGDGAKFPALTAGDWCPLTLVKSDGTLEIVKCTARTLDAFTIARAQEGTQAIEFSAGDRVELRLTAATLDAKLDQAKSEVEAEVATKVVTHAAASKATPVDADELPLVDSASTPDAWGLKKLTWANMKAGIFAAWGALINGGTAKDAPVDADAIAIMDSGASMATKKLLLSKLKAFVLSFASTNVASAATLDLTGQVGKTVHVTGTTAITAVTMVAGQTINLIFDGVLTLTHHATNNNLPGAANITTSAGDRAQYFYDGAAVYCMLYQKADGTAVVSVDATGFAIIYPNGGTEASPANVAINSRYVSPNPFPGHHVICIAEVLYAGVWAEPGWLWTSTGGQGVKSSWFSDSIVTQTGQAGVLNAPNAIGTPNSSATFIATPLPCRIKVWKIKGGIQ